MTSQQDTIQPTANCKYCGGGDPKCSNYVSANHYVTQFQQDTELRDILLTYGGFMSQQIEATDGDPEYIKAIQALTSWKDKEVTKTDVRTLETVCMLLNGDDNQLEVVRNYARNKLKMYNERKKSLQSQGGK